MAGSGAGSPKPMFGVVVVFVRVRGVVSEDVMKCGGVLVGDVNKRTGGQALIIAQRAMEIGAKHPRKNAAVFSLLHKPT